MFVLRPLLRSRLLLPTACESVEGFNASPRAAWMMVFSTVLCQDFLCVQKLSWSESPEAPYVGPSAPRGVLHAAGKSVCRAARSQPGGHQACLLFMTLVL